MAKAGDFYKFRAHSLMLPRQSRHLQQVARISRHGLATSIRGHAVDEPRQPSLGQLDPYVSSAGMARSWAAACGSASTVHARRATPMTRSGSDTAARRVGVEVRSMWRAPDTPYGAR